MQNAKLRKEDIIRLMVPRAVNFATSKNLVKSTMFPCGNIHQ